jgi:hypothetical protein
MMPDILQRIQAAYASGNMATLYTLMPELMDGIEDGTVLEALREKSERKNPKPLTLEELKQRVGKPVWVVTLSKGHESARWRVLERIELEIQWEYYHFGNAVKDGAGYGTTWLSYVHEPAESEGEK